MKSVVLKGIRQPLVVENVAIPTAGAGEVVVAVRAASFNHRDWWIQQGQYAGLKFPIILGSDGSGTVHSVGAGIDTQLIGNEVIIYPCMHWGNEERFPADHMTVLGLPDNGTWAEYVKVPVENIFAKPAHLTFEEAASLGVAGLTAYRALFVRGGWRPGSKVLISGAGGGAAVFAVQYAVAAGSEVYVTSGSDEKIAKALTIGAKAGFNYHEDAWAENLQHKAGRFDVIVDSALGHGFADLVDLAAKGGTIVFFGETAGPIPELNGRKIFAKQLNICGTSSGSPKDFQDMLQFIAAHKIHPVLDETFDLKNAETAMRAMDKGNSRYGKSVLRIK